jgi:hypothetical protein
MRYAYLLIMALLIGVTLSVIPGPIHVANRYHGKLMQAASDDRSWCLSDDPESQRDCLAERAKDRTSPIDWPVLGGGIVLILAIGGGIWWFVRRR